MKVSIIHLVVRLIMKVVRHCMLVNLIYLKCNKTGITVSVMI